MTEVWRPKEVDETPSGDSWLGFQKASIIGVLDLSEEKSKELDFADVYLECEVAIEGSEYTRFVTISGGLVRGADGTLEHNNTIKKVYDFMDVIGCKAGLDMKGNWVEQDGTPIPDMGAYLSANHTQTASEAKPDVYVFVYNKPAKAGATMKDGKPRKYYTNCYGKFWPLNAKGLKDGESFVKWMRSKGYLKEYVEGANGHTEVQEALGGQDTSAMNL